MSDASHPENRPGGSRPPERPGFITQEVQHAQASARVTEKVGRGVFSNGVLVLQGANEFALDFVQRMAQPHQVVARVILPPSVLPSMLAAMGDNLRHYQANFGPPPPLRTPPPPNPPPSVAEIYEGLKLPEELLSGVYANAALISHTQSEFCFDFITNLYPRSAVSCRVFLSAAQVPGLLHSLTQSFQQYQQKLGAGPPKPPPGPAPGK
jgi:hypothetical protein